MFRPLEKVLHVDLTEKTISIENRPELFTKYIGGAGVASKLLMEQCPPNINPFSSNAPLIFATGPFVGIFPNMTKAVAMFKSPLTGNLGESYAGENFSTALRSADYGAIIIKGSSDHPVTLTVQQEDTRIESALSLWNRSPSEVEGMIKQNLGKAAKSVISIGLAGENCVKYASAIVDRYSHFGRLGLGAIMGSKKLKAICVSGSDRKPIRPDPKFEGILKEINRLIDEADTLKKYKDLGTAANVLPLNALGALPSKNFSRSTFERADDVSGENFARAVLESKVTCPNCSVACIHLGNLNPVNASQHEQNPDTPSKKRGLVPYNYQPIFALGTNLEVSEPEKVLRLIGCCERLGMDAIMTGAVLAWATEAYEKGLIDTDETMGLRPEWGDVDTYLEMMENIANLRTECYTALAHGVDAAADRYGGRDFAVSLGKNSPAGYFTGYGHVVGTLVGARHSHLSNAGYSIDQVALFSNVSPEELVESLVKEEDWLNVLNSLVACYFSRHVYTKEIVVKALAVAGVECTVSDLMRLGREISCNLYNYKLREGFDLTTEKIPKRLLELEGPTGRLNPEIIQRMISYYIKIREHAESELCTIRS
jgi:aldehyde:ferredoxin oxidoreductase